MAVSRIIEFKQNSQEARKKKHDMVGNTAFTPSNGQYSDSCVPPLQYRIAQIVPQCDSRISTKTFVIKNMSKPIMARFFFFTTSVTA